METKIEYFTTNRRGYCNRAGRSLYAKLSIRMPLAESERILQSEICRGSTAQRGRCPPVVLALHPRRSQGGTVLLDSHNIINKV